MSSSESMVETEIKLGVADLEGVGRMLRALGFREHRPRMFEANTVFDRPSGEIRANGELLRLREIGGKCLVTYKGKAEITQHKSREELEMFVSDASLCRLIFERLGFLKIFRYEKYRTEYQRPGEAGIVMLDETPIGSFLELEGAPEWIDNLAAALGFTPESYLTSSYGALYKEYCSTRSLVPGDMVFGQTSGGPS